MKENLPIFLRKKKGRTCEFVSKDDDDDALDFIHKGGRKGGRIKDGFFWFREEGGRELMDAKTRTRKPQSCHVC